MRKPRDFDAELKALDQRNRDLKEKKLRQLGELVIATGADALDIDTLAGGLLAMVELGDAGRREKLRERGTAFFRKRTRDAAGGTRHDGIGAQAGDGGAAAN